MGVLLDYELIRGLELLPDAVNMQAGLRALEEQRSEQFVFQLRSSSTSFFTYQ